MKTQKKKIIPKEKAKTVSAGAKVKRAVAKSVIKPIVKVAVKPVPKPAVKPVAKTVAKAVVKAVIKPIEKVVEKKVVEGKKVMNEIKVLNSKFYKNLLTKKQEVEEIINSLLDSQREDINNTSLDNYIEDFDRADREISAQTFYKLLDRKKKELDKINFLLSRIQSDEDFGICEECGMKIPEERLLIMPDASLCVPCQKDLEKFEQRKNLAKNAYSPAQMKREFQLETNEEYDDEDDEGIVIKPDVEHVSFLDMEEIELDDGQLDLNEN
jgi:DnaK suppressor protein